MAFQCTRPLAASIAGLGAVALALGAVALPGSASAQTAQQPAQLQPAQAQPAQAQPAQAQPKPVQPKPAAPAAQPAKPAAPADKDAAKDKDAAAKDKDAASATPPGQLPPGAPNPWVKLCSKDNEKRDVCLIAQELRTQEGQVVASVALREIAGDPKKVLLIAVPPMQLIQPGLRVGVDKGKREEGKFTICFPNACYAEMQITDQFIGTMKTGQALVITTLNLQEKPVNFPLQLAGFKIAQEGPGIDPTQGAQNQQLQQELQKRAEEARQKLTTGDQPKSQ